MGKDLNGKILLWNEGARRIYGYEPEEVVGKADSSILYIDMVMPIMDGLAAVRALAKINPNVRVLVASGLMEKEKTPIPPDDLVKTFLTKPYTAGVLLKVLHQVITENKSTSVE